MLKKLGLEGWFSAHFAYGIVQIVFIPMMVPSFILARTGSATQAGLAMGLFGIAGLLAPLIGIMADKFKAHRLTQALGLIAYMLAGACFVIAGDNFTTMAIGSVLFGAGSAIMLMLNPVFITFAGHDTKTEAMKLGRMSQVLIVGSLLSGIALAAVTEAGWTYEARFIAMIVAVAILFVITITTNKKAAQRIIDNADAMAAAAQEESAPKTGLFKVLFSNFGLFLVAVGILCAGQGAFQAQYPNLMENGYGVAQSLSAATLSVAAVLGLFVLVLAEKFVAKYGAISLFKLCALISIAVVAVLYFIAEAAMVLPYVIPLALVLVYLQGITITDMISPAIAARLTLVGGGYTQGLMMFFISLGFGLGSVVSGVAVDGYGWSALPLSILGLTVISYVCILVVAHKQKKQLGKVPVSNEATV
ncbi:MFS transporter [Vibrio sp. 10N.261.51.F12]|uniref:MFS transporter n=1 Tax=Vibrio sp. 10N.261.51.F12 TaxID=3229679 RepID=UPI00354E6D29